MNEALPARLAGLADEVRAAALPSGCQQTTLWCLGQLPALYAQLGQTSESRYSEAITRLLQGLLKELAQAQAVCPEAQQLAARLTDRLRLLHEEFGLPGLRLPTPGRLSPRSRKAG